MQVNFITKCRHNGCSWAAAGYHMVSSLPTATAFLPRRRALLSLCALCLLYTNTAESGAQKGPGGHVGRQHRVRVAVGGLARPTEAGVPLLAQGHRGGAQPGNQSRPRRSLSVCQLPWGWQRSCGRLRGPEVQGSPGRSSGPAALGRPTQQGVGGALGAEPESRLPRSKSGQAGLALLFLTFVPKVAKPSGQEQRDESPGLSSESHLI